MPSFNTALVPPNDLDQKARARFLILAGLAFLLLTVGLVAALLLRGNIDASSYDPLLGAWHSTDGEPSIEFTPEKTMVEQGGRVYQVKVEDPNTLILSAPDGSTRAVDWLISEEGVLVLVSGERALTYRR